MKIIFIGGRDIHHLGGIENYTYNLASSLVRVGHEIVVYCESDQKGTERIQGIKVVHMKSFGSRFVDKPLLGLFATVHSLLFDRGDIYHFNATGPAFLSFFLPLLFRRPRIWVGHGLEFNRTKYFRPARFLIKMLDGAIPSYFFRNRIVVSNEQKDYYWRNWHRRCTFIPTAVNLPERNAGEYLSVLEKFDLQPNGYYLFMGRLVKDKNPDVLIKAFRQLKSSDRKLVIAGSNSADEQYVSECHAASGDSSKIVFTGNVYGKAKEALLKNCFCFCLVSSMEGFPIALLEAMSYRKACIVSGIPSMHEVLGETGLFVPPENVDSLRAVFEKLESGNISPAQYERYNYDTVKEHYTWDIISKQYMDYAQSVLKSRKC